MAIRPAITSAGAAVLGCLLLAPAAFAAGGESTPLNLGGASKFGDAIDFLLAHPQHRASLSAAGREHWEHAYIYEVVASRYDTLLRGGRGLPELVQPAAALAATDAIRAAFYDAATLAPVQVAAYA